MATLAISRRFDVAASPERVWTYLTSPALVAACLPGAVLLSSSEDGRSHEGTVTVKLGAMSVSYRGTAEFEEVDRAARKLRVKAKGRERTGAGSAEMTMQAEIVATGTGLSRVGLDASASVSGKIVTLGRGMIEVVSEQVLSDFASCLSERLATGGDPSASGAAAAGEGATVGEGAGAHAPDAETAPANLLAILWRALRSRLRRLFGGS